MPDATPAEFLRQLDAATLNAHVRFLLDVQHAQERLARDLAAIVLGAECAAGLDANGALQNQELMMQPGTDPVEPRNQACPSQAA